MSPVPLASTSGKAMAPQVRRWPDARYDGLVGGRYAKGS